MCPCVTVTDGCDEIVLNRLWFLFLPCLLPLIFLSVSLWKYTDSVCLSEVFEQK